MQFKKFTLVAVYVPNAGEGLRRLDYRIKEWDADFHDYICSLRSTFSKPVILAGDLNVIREEIDIYDIRGKESIPGATPQERQSFAEFLKRGFVDTYRFLHPASIQYTFWSVRQKLRESNRGWRLDYFLISDDYDQPPGIELVDALIEDRQMGSDHCPVALKLKLPLEGEVEQRSKHYTEESLRSFADISLNPQNQENEEEKKAATDDAPAEDHTTPKIVAKKSNVRKRAQSVKPKQSHKETTEVLQNTTEEKTAKKPSQRKKSFLRKGQSKPNLSDF